MGDGTAPASGPPIEVHAVGHVESALAEPADAPRQGDEGAPAAWIVLDDAVWAAAADLGAGDEVLVLTWLHRGDRSALVVHTRGDLERTPQGVFSTRSPDRPNPIGLHRARVVAVDRPRLRVDALEAVDGTPVLDPKPVLGGVDER